MTTQIISADEIKKNLPGYNPKLAEKYHHESAHLADQVLKKALKASGDQAVIPDDLSRAFIAFLHRDRKFRDEHFYKTHSGSRSTLQYIAINYPDIPIRIIESSYTEDKHMKFAQILFDHYDQFIKYLEIIQISENAIIDQVSRQL